MNTRVSTGWAAVLCLVWCSATVWAEDDPYKQKVKTPENYPKPELSRQPKGKSKEKESGEKRRGDAIKMHIANLSDKDPEVRQTSAQILGTMGATQAIPYLIESLRDRHVYTQIYAHGALNKLTGKNFGYKNYREWKRWWEGAKDDFEKKKERAGVNDMAKIRAKSSNTQGLIYLDSRDFRSAYRMFLDAVNSDPEVPDYRNNLGLAVMELGRENPYRYIDAIVYFQEAIGLDEGLPQPYLNIGQCFSRLGKHIEAQHWYRKAIARDKNGILWEHCWKLGKDLLKKADYQLALEYLQDARNKAESNRRYEVRIYRDLALAEYALDMYHSAYRNILNVQRLGYDLDPDFVGKVRKALIDRGIDPDKEDELARKEARKDYTEPANKR